MLYTRAITAGTSYTLVNNRQFQSLEVRVKYANDDLTILGAVNGNGSLGENQSVTFTAPANAVMLHVT
jgi:hypothetical protein